MIPVLVTVLFGLLLAAGCVWFWRSIPLVEHSEWLLLDAMTAEEAKRQGEER